jgi:hypothetical protein
MAMVVNPKESDQILISLHITIAEIEMLISVASKIWEWSYRELDHLSGFCHNFVDNDDYNDNGDDARSSTSDAAQEVSYDLDAFLDHAVAAHDVEFDPDDEPQDDFHHDAGAPYEYCCATQDFRYTELSFNMVSGNQVHRWAPGSCLTYYVDKASFVMAEPHREWKYFKLKEGMATAAEDWNASNIGVTFQEVPSQRGVTFMVVYDPYLPNSTYAVSFFPGMPGRILRVGRSSFSLGNVLYISNVLDHEFGHILGIRHTYWQENEHGHALYYPTIFLDSASIMNRKLAPNLSLFAISSQDAREVREFYALPTGWNPISPDSFFQIIDHPA